MNTRAEFRRQPLMAFRTGAIVVAIVSGAYALAALLVGSPLEFGAALDRAVRAGSPQTSSNGRLSASVPLAEGLCRLRCFILAMHRRVR